MFFSLCGINNLQNENNVTCNCGDREVPVISETSEVFSQKITQRIPVVVVENSEDFKAALKLTCKCNLPGVKDYQAVYRKINENFFVRYDRSDIFERYNIPNRAVLTVREVPKLSQVRALIKTIEDLRQREPSYVCEPNFFVNEFDNLDDFNPNCLLEFE